MGEAGFLPHGERVRMKGLAGRAAASRTPTKADDSLPQAERGAGGVVGRAGV